MLCDCFGMDPKVPPDQPASGPVLLGRSGRSCSRLPSVCGLSVVPTLATHPDPAARTVPLSFLHCPTGQRLMTQLFALLASCCPKLSPTIVLCHCRSHAMLGLGGAELLPVRIKKGTGGGACHTWKGKGWTPSQGASLGRWCTFFCHHTIQLNPVGVRSESHLVSKHSKVPALSKSQDTLG